MKLKSAWWLLVAIVLTLAGSAAADQATNSVATSTNAPSTATNAPTVSTNLTTATNTVVEAKDPGDIFTNSVGMVLIKLPGGYWAGKYEVTQKEYQAVVGSNPSAFGGDDLPVNNLSWNDAVEFCDKLTSQDIATNALPKGYVYSLPTEDEWESMVADASLDNAVTSQNGPLTGPKPVGSMAPNSLGLYDMRGNVMEFCQGDTAKAYRVLRGGSWQDHLEPNLRTEFRFYCKPEDAQNTFGFRCVLKQK